MRADSDKTCLVCVSQNPLLYFPDIFSRSSLKVSLESSIMLKGFSQYLSYIRVIKNLDKYNGLLTFLVNVSPWPNK